MKIHLKRHENTVTNTGMEITKYLTYTIEKLLRLDYSNGSTLTLIFEGGISLENIYGIKLYKSGSSSLERRAWKFKHKLKHKLSVFARIFLSPFVWRACISQ